MFFNEFPFFCILFVVHPQIAVEFEKKNIQDGGTNRVFVLKKSTFTKPPVIWEILSIFTKVKRQKVVQGSQIHIPYVFVNCNILKWRQFSIGRLVIILRKS
jgi:hypothetical protein